MTNLLVGGVTVDREQAMVHARHYLTDGSGWAYPSYDAYEAARATGPLTDADFLAPLLLNVNELKIRTYEALQKVRGTLDEILNRVPVDLHLADANPDDLLLLGELFAVLDEPGVWGARGTVLAKVLHRKRPHFVPLYDEQVRAVYQDGPDATVTRAPKGGRPWSEFIVLFATAVQADLHREHAFWQQIVELAPGPKITTLRALDIVAWWAGRPFTRAS
jgi:hypothetical protein